MFYPSAGSSLPDLPVHTNTNSHISKSAPDCSLTQLLNDIQACRWKFFRPRPLQDNSRSEDKKGTPQVEKGGGTPLSNSVSGEASELNRIQKVNQLNFVHPYKHSPLSPLMFFNTFSLSIIFNMACWLILMKLLHCLIQNSVLRIKLSREFNSSKWLSISRLQSKCRAHLSFFCCS